MNCPIVLQITVIMKNKIDFLRKEAIPKRDTSTCNHYEKAEELIKKTPTKLIKGKVKTYKKNVSPKRSDNEYFEDNLELTIISKRMLLFLKVSSIFMIISSLFLLLKEIS